MLEAHDSTSGDQSTAAARFAKRLAARECEEFDLADEKGTKRTCRELLKKHLEPWSVLGPHRRLKLRQKQQTLFA